jgi:hypothetical protein
MGKPVHEKRTLHILRQIIYLNCQDHNFKKGHHDINGQANRRASGFGKKIQASV